MIHKEIRRVKNTPPLQMMYFIPPSFPLFGCCDGKDETCELLPHPCHPCELQTLHLQITTRGRHPVRVDMPSVDEDISLITIWQTVPDGAHHVAVRIDGVDLHLAPPRRHSAAAGGVADGCNASTPRDHVLWRLLQLVVELRPARLELRSGLVEVQPRQEDEDHTPGQEHSPPGISVPGRHCDEQQRDHTGHDDPQDGSRHTHLPCSAGLGNERGKYRKNIAYYGAPVNLPAVLYTKIHHLIR